MRPELQMFSFPLSLILAAALFVASLIYPRKCPHSLSFVVLCLLAAAFAVLGCLKPDPGGGICQASGEIGAAGAS